MNNSDLNKMADATTTCITITVNGSLKECKPHCLVSELLELLSLRGGPVAVERNLHIVPSDQFTEVQLEDGDQLEIVSLTGGG